MNMAGETDLAVLLRELRPEPSDVEFGFACLPAGAALPAGLKPTGLFEEDEGTTLVAPSSVLKSHGIDHVAGWARITLKVHSSLAAIGLTAAVSGALAEAGISCNMIAAYHHDHIFVPWERREEAMAALRACSARAGKV
jgi:hypothetical protein